MAEFHSTIRTPIPLLACIIGPVRTEVDPVTKETVLGHLQKFSTCGFLLTWPFCFHFWFFWKKQERITDNGITYWIPGSEQGIYMRTPGFRYTTGNGMTWTWGYFGLHWD